jgi:hypothetical protein
VLRLGDSRPSRSLGIEIEPTPAISTFVSGIEIEADPRDLELALGIEIEADPAIST